MVPTLTMLGRFNAAARGAVVPWLEITLVTPISMTRISPEVTPNPPLSFNFFLGIHSRFPAKVRKNLFSETRELFRFLSDHSLMQVDRTRL